MKEKIINAEQINIVGKNGIPRLSLFNEDNIPNVLFRGEEIFKGHRQNDNIAGMLFFNPDGTEAGGLIYGNDVDENGNTTAGVSLTLDQFEQDQVVQLLYTKDGDQHQYGMHIFDRPTAKTIKEQDDEVQDALKIEDEATRNQKIEEIYNGNVPRAFIGKQNNEMTINLYDTNYRPRIKVYVDEQGEPHLKFFDADGKVTYSLPPEK